MSKGQNIKGGICSDNGILTFTFSSKLMDLSIQKRFFQTIAADGVDVAVETNGAYYDG
jgi:pyruvate-formate lyase-activating enzyme